MSHSTVHYVLGFCPFDLLALAVLAGVLVMVAVYTVRQRRRERELEDELAARLAEQALQDKQPQHPSAGRHPEQV